MDSVTRYPHVFSPLDLGFTMAAYYAERARGGVGMIITGGIAPNAEAGVGGKLSTPEEAAQHRLITQAVHAADADVKIVMQILHTGALAGTPDCVAPSPVKSRIGVAELVLHAGTSAALDIEVFAREWGIDFKNHPRGGVEYLKIDDTGPHTRVKGEPRLFAVDTVIVCAGQTPLRQLADDLQAAGVKAHRVGGAFEAAELDAKRAIDQACRLAAEV